MSRTLALSILLCFVSYHVGITNSQNSVDQKPVVTVSTEALPEPLPPSTTKSPGPPTTATPKPTDPPITKPTNPTTKPTTAPTTVAPITTKPTTPPSTTSTTTPPTPTTTNSSSTTTIPTTPTSAPTHGTTNGTTVSPSTTSAPPVPPPSDRKFDAFSFLGGFALGLGLVAIGFLSWKFYLSRQENYYHTL